MNRLFSKKPHMSEGFLLIFWLSVYCVFVYVFKLPCPIYFLTGVSCPGCGMTRALFSLLSFDFKMAFHYHPLIYICIFLFPALVVAHIKGKRLTKKILVAIFVILFLATYLYRLFVLKSPILHFTPENGVFVKFLTKAIDKIHFK